MPVPPFTSVVSLDGRTWTAPIPSCAKIAENNHGKLQDVYRAMSEARRIVVLCGAGISVHAGIPDFRSPSGLFQSLKRDHPKENISSGRDLFDSAVFKSEETTSVFYKMISHLATLSESAEPTPFHSMLQDLDSRGQLLRVYTQNIDALEERAGLSFGIPTFPSRTRKRKVATLDGSPATPARSSSSEVSPSPPQLLTPPRTAHASNLTSPSSTPTPSTQLPRCVPLHGTLRNLYCPSCYHTLPLCTPQHLKTLSCGNSLACPQCTELDGTRRLVGKRTRGVARLRPGVVLYNEPHREGEAERVGECVRRDLIGLGSGQLSRAGSTRKKRGGDDLLIVAGTSLRIPGAKRIVREFAKALHPPAESSNHAISDESTVKTVYLNLDFPVPAREWDGVFDVWVQGDVQSFAHGFGQYQARVERESSVIGPSPSSAARIKTHTIVERKESRASTSTDRKRSLEEPSLESLPHASIKKSKQRVSPLTSSLMPPHPLPPTYSLTHSPRPPGAAARGCINPNPIRGYPETARLTIKIRRPVGHVPTTATTGCIHSAIPVPPEAETTSFSANADQQSRRTMLPVVAPSNVAT